MPASTNQSHLGFINIAKPQGVTAHDVVASVRRILQLKQVGHGGTLDPMATGVLPIAVGKATRLLRFLEGDKTYLAEITLGTSTDTLDITGQVSARSEVHSKTEEIEQALISFTGQISQIPPLFSAIHVNGKRLYELAREGKIPAAIPARTVIIHSIELVSYIPPVLTIRVACSAGTYIRAIARDLGDILGCGGCLSALSREKAGPFSIDTCLSLEQLSDHALKNTLHKAILKPEALLQLSHCQVDQDQARQLIHGKSIQLELDSSKSNCESTSSDKPKYLLILHQENLIAICRLTDENARSFVRIQPEVVLANAIDQNS